MEKETKQTSISACHPYLANVCLVAKEMGELDAAAGSASYDGSKKWSLAIFMLCSCSGCVLIFLAGITPGINSFSAPVAVQPLRMPAIQPNTNANVQTPITREDTLTIRRYLQTIDSMSQTQEGKAQLDAYFRQRPGLSDSIAVLRKIFYHQ